MKIKRIIALLTSAVVLGTSAMSVSAVEYDKTETYYVYQQETYGEVTLYPSYALGNTYCEKATVAKMTQIAFCYVDSDSGWRITVERSSDAEYTTNNNQCNLYRYSDPVNNLDYSIGARTKSGVKVTSYITWTSDGCEDNAQVGTV